MATETGLAPATSAMELALIKGDLSGLSETQRLAYYKSVCESLDLNPLTKPFDYINLQGKLTLYAKRDATDQLRKRNEISVQIVTREVVEDIYVVTARASDPKGRADESIGAVPIATLKGEARANAIMKAETKAKRRVTLSICGLGWLDETETETLTTATVPAPALPPPAPPAAEPPKAPPAASGSAPAPPPRPADKLQASGVVITDVVFVPEAGGAAEHWVVTTGTHGQFKTADEQLAKVAEECAGAGEAMTLSWRLANGRRGVVRVLQSIDPERDVL